jgi:hypothetical protein
MSVPGGSGPPIEKKKTMTACSFDKCEDRRRLQDRRQRPTSFLGSLRLRGRRKGFRRQDEAEKKYVDCPSGESTLDAFFTLMHVQEGGGELNPLMEVLLSRGVSPFMRVKMTLTIIGCSLLAVHQNFPLGLWGLRLMGGAYLMLMAYHAFLFFL